MKKTAISVFTIVLYCIITTSVCFANNITTTVRVEQVHFPVRINDTIVNAQEDAYPVLMYNGITYLPLTYNMKQYIGLQAQYYNHDYIHNLLFVGLDERVKSIYNNYPVTKTSLNEFSSYADILDCLVTLNSNSSKTFKANNIEKYPLLMYKDIIYLPLTWDICVEKLGWYYYYDSEKGLYIDTTIRKKPIVNLRNFIAGPSSAYHTMSYFYFDNGWVGYPDNTLEGNTSFKFMFSNYEEKEIYLPNSLDSTTYFMNCRINENSNQLIYDVSPSINNSIFTIHCVKTLNGVSENILLKIDLLSNSLFEIETI